MTQALFKLLIAQLVFWGAGVFFIQDKPIIVMFIYPEFFIYTVLSGLAALSFGFYSGKKLLAQFLEFFTLFLYFYGLFSLCLFSLSGLGFVEWVYVAFYLLLRLGIVRGKAQSVQRVVYTSVFDSSIILLFLGILRRIIEIVLPVNVYIETLQYNSILQNLLFWIFIVIIGFFALRFLERTAKTVSKYNKKVSDTDAENDEADSDKVLHVFFKKIAKIFTNCIKAIVKFINLLISEFGFVPVLLSVAIIVLIPLVFISIEIKNTIIAMQKFFWDIGTMLFKHISTRRWYQPYGILEKLRDFVVLIMIFIFIMLNQSVRRKKPQDVSIPDYDDSE